MPQIGFSVRLTALAVALAAGAAGCGGSDEGDASAGPAATPSAAAKRDIQEAADRLQADFRRGDAARACERLTPRGRRATGAEGAEPGTTCEEFVAGVLREFGDTVHMKLDVVRLRLDGDTAFVTVKAETGSTYPLRWSKAGGHWKLDQTVMAYAN